MTIATLALAGCSGSTGTTAAEAEPGAASASVAASPSATQPSPAQPSPAQPSSAQPSPAGARDPAPRPGAYIDHATYRADPAAHADGDVVLFFHAPWCPSCRETEESLTTDGVPDGLTVVKVDYDSATDLRRTYGVTYQHTFVAVDQTGTQLKKWSGSSTGAQIKAQVA